ncbi:MAG: ABC transporter permease [Bacteroidetes bacterium]|nr:ABC transporter permease [Bacteroidota bacterium]
MKNIYSISLYTLREALSRKVFITFFAVSTFVLLIFTLLFSTISVEGFFSVSTVRPESTNSLLANVAGALKTMIVIPLYGGGLFLSIFSAASFIPNMLEKGSVDLMLSFPVSRREIILGKFFGGILMVLVNIAYLVLGIWLLIGIKFGNWDSSFLFAIPTIVFAFSSLYGMIILIGILTQNSVLSMMISYLIFFIFSPILSAKDSISSFINNGVVTFIIDVMHFIVPKTSELGSITANLAAGVSISDIEPFATSLIILILNLVLSIIIFNKKDY